MFMLCCCKKMKSRSKEVQCERCQNWHHANGANISDDNYASLTEAVWRCQSSCHFKKNEKDTPKVKLLPRKMDNIIRTVKTE